MMKGFDAADTPSPVGPIAAIFAVYTCVGLNGKLASDPVMLAVITPETGAGFAKFPTCTGLVAPVRKWRIS